MKRLCAYLILVGWSGFALPGQPTPFIESIQGYSLGSDRIEFYEARVVYSSPDHGDIVDMLRPLCREFPRLDSYMIRVFTDVTVAGEAARMNLSNLNQAAAPVSVKKGLLAEVRPGGETVIWPLQLEARKVVKHRGHWCTN